MQTASPKSQYLKVLLEGAPSVWLKVSGGMPPGSVLDSFKMCSVIINLNFVITQSMEESLLQRMTKSGLKENSDKLK